MGPVIGDWTTSVDETEIYVLRLYVAGASPNSVRAIANTRAICDLHLAGRYELEIVDIHQDSLDAETEQIIAVPLLVRNAPLPKRRLIGDMSDTKKVLRGLGLD